MVSYPCFALLLRNSVLKFTTMPRRYALIIIPIVALGLIGLPMARAANFTKGRDVKPFTTELKPGDYLWHPEVSPAGPVVVLVSLPDLGWKDVGFNDCTDIKTPNIGALATGGATFTQFYVQPMCAPTRAALEAVAPDVI